MSTNYQRLKRAARHYWAAKEKRHHVHVLDSRAALVSLLEDYEGIITYQGGGRWRVFDAAGRSSVSFKLVGGA